MICAIEVVILFIVFVLLIILECIFNRKSKFKDMYKPIDGSWQEELAYAGVKGIHFDEMNKTIKIAEWEALYDMFLWKTALLELLKKLDKNDRPLFIPEYERIQKYKFKAKPRWAFSWHDLE